MPASGLDHPWEVSTGVIEPRVIEPRGNTGRRVIEPREAPV